MRDHPYFGDLGNYIIADVNEDGMADAIVSDSLRSDQTTSTTTRSLIVSRRSIRRGSINGRRRGEPPCK